MIKDFDKNDLPSLINIWQVCFGDEREFIEDFFDSFKERMKIAVHSEDGRIVSSLYCLPAQLRYGEKSVKAKYIYAVATLPEYRRRGFSGELINEVKNLDDETQVLFLTPSSEKNRCFYKKFGFEDSFFSYSFEYEKTGKNVSIEIKKRENEDLFELREKLLQNCPHVSFGKKHLDFAFKNNVYLAYKGERNTGYFHFDKTDENFVIDEVLVAKDDLYDVLEKACETFNAKKVKVSAQYGEKCCKISKGMIYCKFDDVYKELSENQFYFGVNLE